MATIPQDRQIHARLHISRPDGQTWVDVSPHLVRAEVELGDVSSVGTGNSGVDSVVRRMTFTLMPERANIPTWPITAGRDASEVIGDATDVVAQTMDPGYVWYDYLLNTPHTMQGDGFAPGDKSSAWNQFNGEYAPLLQSMREAILYVATTDPGVPPQPTDWVTLFHGYLGDSTRTEGSSVTCECRDLAKRLQKAVIEDNQDYGSESGTPAETVIQQIIDNNLGAGVVQLYCPVSPGFMITPYTVDAEQSTKTVWDAIQEVAAQIGWFLGYRWDTTTQAYRLMFMEPPRGKDLDNPDFVLDWEWDFYVHTLDITDKDIRNAIRVSYRDKATGERKSVTVTNQASIDEYGRCFMGIGEADTSHIDTAAEAQAMGEAAASDLGDLSGARSIDMPLLPTMDVFAGVVTRDPRISTDDEFTGVESVRHVIDFGGERFRTEVSGTSRVVGGHQRWLDMETRPGSPALPTPPEAIGGGGITLPAPTVTPEDIKPIPGGIEVHVPAPPVHSVRWSETRVWVSEVDGFDPTGMKPWASGRMDSFPLSGMAGGITVYIRAAYVDADKRVSAYSEQVAGTTGSTGEEPDLTQPDPPTGLTAIPVVGGFVLTWDRHEAPPPLDRYVLERASSEDGFASWVTVNDEIRSAYYSDLGLNNSVEYSYRIVAISRAQVASDPSNPTTPALPGKLSLSEQTVGNILGTRVEEGTLPADAFDEPLQQARAKWNASGEFVEQLSVQSIGPDEISSAVGEVYPDGTGAQSAIQQNATAISQRVSARDQDGNLVTAAEIRVAARDGQGHILLNAEQVIVPGTIKGNLIEADTITTDRIIAGNLIGFVVAAGVVTMPTTLNQDGTYGVRIPLPQPHLSDDVVVVTQIPSRFDATIGYNDTVSGGPFFLAPTLTYYRYAGQRTPDDRYQVLTVYAQPQMHDYTSYKVLSVESDAYSVKPRTSNGVIDEVFLIALPRYLVVRTDGSGNPEEAVVAYNIPATPFEVTYAVVVRDGG